MLLLDTGHYGVCIGYGTDRWFTRMDQLFCVVPIDLRTCLFSANASGCTTNLNLFDVEALNV